MTDHPDEDATISLDEIGLRQIDRLPQLARRWLLQIDPLRALERDAADDALEIAAAQVVATGRAFDTLSDAERQAAIRHAYEYTFKRNTDFLHGLNEVRN